MYPHLGNWYVKHFQSLNYFPILDQQWTEEVSRRGTEWWLLNGITEVNTNLLPQFACQIHLLYCKWFCYCIDMYRKVSSYNFVISCNINFVEKPVGRKCVFFFIFLLLLISPMHLYQENPYSGKGKSFVFFLQIRWKFLCGQSF